LKNTYKLTPIQTEIVNDVEYVDSKNVENEIIEKSLSEIENKKYLEIAKIIINTDFSKKEDETNQIFKERIVESFESILKEQNN
jgi:hypothetical protein